MKTKNYKVTYEYRGKITVDVEAKDEKEAEILGLEEADSHINCSLSVYDVTVEEKENYED